MSPVCHLTIRGKTFLQSTNAKLYNANNKLHAPFYFLTLLRSFI